jgi:hypothetical protein
MYPAVEMDILNKVTLFDAVTKSKLDPVTASRAKLRELEINPDELK